MTQTFLKTARDVYARGRQYRRSIVDLLERRSQAAQDLSLEVAGIRAERDERIKGSLSVVCKKGDLPAGVGAIYLLSQGQPVEAVWPGAATAAGTRGRVTLNRAADATASASTADAGAIFRSITSWWSARKSTMPTT